MAEPRTKGQALCAELKANPRINAASIDGNVLSTILNAKVSWLERKQQELPLESFAGYLKKSERSFYDALTRNRTVFILECKKASPSKGLIRPEFNPVEIASVYRRYASAISVLADEPFFQGKYEYIAEVSRAVDIPVLCKDFIYDPYQVYLARHNNADAILLMLSVLTDEAYTELCDLAHSLGMGVLTEASHEDEIERAIRLNARIVGINNRNLRTLTVDLNQVRKLSALVPDDRVIISESGIYTHDEVLNLRHYANGFLVGSSLTSEPDIDKACRRLIYGENKICGITRIEDAVSSHKAGIYYNGLIFAEKSPRYITPEKAKSLIIAAVNAGCNQEFVGVFVNTPAEKAAETAALTGISVIQLHGSEDGAYISELAAILSEMKLNVKIWKAVPVKNNVYPAELVNEYLENSGIDRVLLDTGNASGFGGTGQTFDWSLVTGDRSRIIVAGGLNPENAAAARDMSETVGLDLNSGLEDAPGIKNPEKIAAALKAVTSY